MNAAEAYMAALAPGMEIIAGAGALQKTHPVARELLRLHETYFGECTFSRKQRATVAAARETGKSLAAMRIIEKRVAGIKPAASKWELRRELCTLRASEDELDTVAKARAAELKKAPEPKSGVSVIKGKKKWGLKVVGDSEDIASMAACLGKTLESAKRFFFQGRATAKVQKRTNVIITLDQLVEVIEGRGDDIALRMTNGAVTTGARLIQDLFETKGLVTLVHPVRGPVNLYRTERHANWKQRQMAMAESPTCGWPGCRAAAEECEIHHLQAWRLGGETNPENLSVLCRYHNGVNDDDPNAPPRRGRMERHDGTIVWRPPWAG